MIKKCSFCKKLMECRKERSFCNRRCMLGLKKGQFRPKHCTVGVVNCKEKIYAKFMCKFHYSQKRFTGYAGKRKKVVYGTGSILSNGYRMIMLNGKQVREHRVIMENHLGRKLSKNEVVHHKNHIKHDNRICNLEIKSPSEHIRDHMLEFWKNKRLE